MIGIVTGVGNGIGLDIIKSLLTKNINIIGISRSKNENIKKLEKKYPNQFQFFLFDLKKINKIKNLTSKIFSKNKRIDFLINNAGVRSRIELNKLDNKKITEVLNINLIAPINLTKNLLRNINNKYPISIVMVTSIVGNRGFASLSNYASSKGALESFSKSVAIEYAKKNVRINCVAPGFIKTSYFKAFKKRTNLYKWTKSKIPMGRWGNPSEVTPLIEFLISQKSSYITGTTIFVDGGWTAN
jgi:3-oxoacyl-[acyl-carrier protein] reductase